MTISPEQLTAWKRLADEATSGPWDSYFETGLNPMVVTYTENEKGLRSLKDAVVHGPSITNNNFIAAARTAVPALIDAYQVSRSMLETKTEECRHLRIQFELEIKMTDMQDKQIDRLRKQLEKCREQRNGYRENYWAVLNFAKRERPEIVNDDDAELDAIGKVGE